MVEDTEAWYYLGDRESQISRKNTYMKEQLGFIGTRTTSLQLAVLAFEDKPMRARMTDVADPLDQGALALDELERVVTVGRDGHCCDYLKHS